jgi:tRNA nucleotidyltransferase/poly(A) polymerase
MTEATKGFALEAIEDGVLKRLSRRRIWREVDLALQEDCAFQILEKIDQFHIWSYLFPGYDFDLSLKDHFENIVGKNPLFKKALRKPNLPLLRFLLLVYPMDRDYLNTFFEEVQIPRYYREAVWRFKDYVNAMSVDDDDFSTLAWYEMIAENPPEVFLASYMKVSPLWQKRIYEAFNFYRKFKILCSKQDIRALEGYQRGILTAIFSDLLDEKKKGKVRTKEEELAYICENLKNCKYKGEMDV